jgi:hypothetical protein
MDPAESYGSCTCTGLSPICEQTSTPSTLNEATCKTQCEAVLQRCGYQFEEKDYSSDSGGLCSCTGKNFPFDDCPLGTQNAANQTVCNSLCSKKNCTGSWCRINTPNGSCDDSTITSTDDGIDVIPAGKKTVPGKKKESNCIGADMKLFSCTAQMYLPAKEISMGDSVRTLAEDGSSACSDVYFSFLHEDESEVVEIVVESTKDKQESKIVLSRNHLVYSGSSSVAVMAKNIQAGDLLVSSDGSLKKVVDIKDGESALINILTLEGNIELQNGVVISSYSFHETLYAAAFYPVKIMYWMFGGSMVKASFPYLEEIERALTPSFVALVSMMSV